MILKTDEKKQIPDEAACCSASEMGEKPKQTDAADRSQDWWNAALYPDFSCNSER